MKNYRMLFLIVLLTVVYTPTVVFSLEEPSPQGQKPVSRQEMSRAEPETTVYPLFRAHAARYYPERSPRKAALLSAAMPGLGQAYADNYTKATLFLTAELGVFALAGYNIARALHYRNHDAFQTGFYDERTDSFLDSNQVQARMRDRSLRGALFLITGIGLHVWNILDASHTVKAYNHRRISVQMQQTLNGTHALMFTHRF